MTDWATQTQTFHGDSKAWLGSAMNVDAGLPGELDLALFDFTTNFPNGFIPSGVVLARRTSDNVLGHYDPGTVVNEAQTITITGTPTGGTFTLGFEGETTAAIAFNANAAAVESALEDLDSITDVTVTGGPGPGTPYVVAFGGTLADTNVPQMTATGAFTGGTSPAVAVTTGTAGGGTAGATGGAGLNVAVGHLLMPVSARDQFGFARISGPSTCAVFTRGRVREAKLPTNHRLDAAAKAALRFIEYITL